MKQNIIKIVDDVAYVYPTNYDKPIMIDKEDIDLISNYCWSVKKDTEKHIYARARERGTKRFVLMHRIITKERSRVVDHINHNTLDNRKENLNCCTQKENQQNRIKQKSIRLSAKGYSIDRKCPNNPYLVTAVGKQIGYTDSPEKAKLMRIEYAIKNNIKIIS